MEKAAPCQGRPAAAWALAVLLVTGLPTAAGAQVFLAAQPHPPFAIGPLFLRATVGPELGPVTIDLLWSLAYPPHVQPAAVGQDLTLLWPDAVAGAPGLGPPDADLARYVEARGVVVIDEGRLPLLAQNFRDPDGAGPVALAGGAPFVTFVRQGGALGLTAPATWIRIPWTPRLVDRDWLVNLRIPVRSLVTPRPASWFEDAFRGRRHRLTVSFHDVRHRAVFPLYFEHRNRVVRLADEPSEILVNFRANDRLKIDEVSPPTSSRRLSETLDTTEVVSLFLDRSEGIAPQVLTVGFGYTSGLQAWAPVLIPTLFFVLGNLAAVAVRLTAERVSRRLAGRVTFGRPGPRQARQQGVLLPRETLARIAPGTTTADEVLRLCGTDVEQLEKSAAPGHRTLLYRGRRLVPEGRRLFGWLTTVRRWDVEHHEVEIEVDREVVSDVQVRVRRSRLERLEPA